MSNDIFKALSSTTRLKMLKTLAKKEMHISGLARELNLSVPVVDVEWKKLVPVTRKRINVKIKT